MCYITATELKENLTKYMEMSSLEDVYVTKNNKVITVLTSPKQKAIKDFLAMGGSLGNLPKNADYKKDLKEEMEKHESAR